MKSFLIAAGCCALALTWAGAALGAAKPAAPVSKEPVAPPKSVFINDPAVGKDPFFPKSTRRPLPITNVIVQASQQVVSTGVPDDIVIKGINLLKSRRLAIINNVTLAQGEECDLKIKGKTVRIRCVEVKDKSVVVSVGGVSKEIALRPGL